MRDRYALIGNPVMHSKSPLIHAEFARATGEALDYGLIEAPREGFRAAVDAFRAQGGKGLNVTVPFKEDAFLYCKRASERAQAAGVVNTLVLDRGEPYGDITDGVGLIRDLEARLGVKLAGRRVLLLGAGGAAQAVLKDLSAAGASRLVIANRTLERARRLAARVPGVGVSDYEHLAEPFDVVINATSAGLAGEAPLLPGGVIGKGSVAYEMVYGRDTPFLAAARAAGARCHDGLGMLVEQAAESFFVWRGVRPETGPVLARLRAA
jgi:shikimate dehydrogenase